MRSFLRGCGFIFVLLVGLQGVHGQVQGFYPADGATVSFEDLQIGGFLWFPTTGVSQFDIEVVKNTNTGQQILTTYSANSYPFTLPAEERSIYTNGDYLWRVVIKAVEEGMDPGFVGATSSWIAFKISSGGILIPTPTPTGTPQPMPTPVVDGPRNIRYTPSQEITLTDVVDFTIHWDPPAYPEGGNFVYDVTVLWPNNTYEPITASGLSGTSYKPFFSPITSFGIFTVYIRARETGGAGVSNITQSTFTTRRPTPPTPTPVPIEQNPDLTRDGIVDAVDVAQFVRSFHTRDNINLNFNARADLNGDGFIDRLDLLTFLSLYRQYKNKSGQLTAPSWSHAIVPVISSQSSTTGCEINGENRIDFPPNVITFSQTRCNISEINGTVFHFNPVESAVDYEVTLDTDKTIVLVPKIFKTSQYGHSLTSFKFLAYPDTQVLVTVKAIGESGEMSQPSEALTVVVPPQTE